MFLLCCLTYDLVLGVDQCLLRMTDLANLLALLFTSSWLVQNNRDGVDGSDAAATWVSSSPTNCESLTRPDGFAISVWTTTLSYLKRSPVLKFVIFSKSRMLTT